MKKIMKFKKLAPGEHEKIGYFFIVPAVLFMFIFVGYPIFYNVLLSFYKVDLRSLNTGVSEFVGLANYKALFAPGTNTIKVISNTLFFTVVCLIFQFTIGFLFALFFNLEFKLAKVVRGLIMVAWLVPITVTALNFKFMFWVANDFLNC